MYLYEAIELMGDELFLQFFNTNTKLFYHSPKKHTLLYTTDAINGTDYFNCKEFPEDGWIKLDNIKGKLK